MTAGGRELILREQFAKPHEDQLLPFQPDEPHPAKTHARVATRVVRGRRSDRSASDTRSPFGKTTKVPGGPLPTIGSADGRSRSRKRVDGAAKSTRTEMSGNWQMLLSRRSGRPPVEKPAQDPRLLELGRARRRHHDRIRNLQDAGRYCPAAARSHRDARGLDPRRHHHALRRALVCRPRPDAPGDRRLLRLPAGRLGAAGGLSVRLGRAGAHPGQRPRGHVDRVRRIRSPDFRHRPVGPSPAGPEPWRPAPSPAPPSPTSVEPVSARPLWAGRRRPSSWR